MSTPYLHTLSIPSNRTRAIAWHGTEGVADASDLGLPVGVWPVRLHVTSQRTGKTLMFDCTAGPHARPSEYGAVYYASGSSLKITVLNS
jgi:hypothetical protein